ncbi:MAG: hypothetical protein V4787_01095 [Pseudomonadota bacterium]
MLFNLTLPPINEQMTTASLTKVAAPEGSEVPVGGKLLEVKLTVGAVEAYDCPPVSHFSLNTRDRVWVRRWSVADGDELAVGAQLGLFSTEPDEPLDGAPVRQVRLTVAGIVPDLVGWGDWK